MISDIILRSVLILCWVYMIAQFLFRQYKPAVQELLAELYIKNASSLDDVCYLEYKESVHEAMKLTHVTFGHYLCNTTALFQIDAVQSMALHIIFYYILTFNALAIVSLIVFRWNELSTRFVRSRWVRLATRILIMALMSSLRAVANAFMDGAMIFINACEKARVYLVSMDQIIDQFDDSGNLVDDQDMVDDQGMADDQDGRAKMALAKP